MNKLNWRLILIHFVACWLLFHALWQLGYLYDYRFAEKIIHHDYKDLGPDASYRIGMIPLKAAITGLVGLLIGFVVSLMICLKYKWYWVNSIIVFFIAFASFCLNRFYYDHISFIFRFPGRIFNSDWAFTLTNGLVMLTAGILLFFLQNMIRFVNGNRIKDRKAESN